MNWINLRVRLIHLNIFSAKSINLNRSFFSLPTMQTPKKDKWLLHTVQVAPKYTLLDKYSIEYALRAASPPEKL